MASTKKGCVNVIEHCGVAPPPGTVVEQSLPLTFFDLPWLGMMNTPFQVLYFHEFRHSRTHFLETVIPNLKHSLSLTLQHFFPLAGTLILPSPPAKPTIHCANGNSVSLTFAESTADFNHLAGYHPRNAHEFYHLLPQLQPIAKLSGSGDTVVTPLVAIQVTLSPNQGRCFGFSYWHALGDGRAFVGFIKTWASISKLGGDKGLSAAGSLLPFHDRSVIRDQKGLESIYLTQVSKHFKSQYYQTRPHVPADQVRATFSITRPDIQRLKSRLESATRPPLHVSTFSVICSYLWVCLIKLRAATVEEAEAEAEHGWEQITFPMDCRRRLDPPIPDTYFGNCLVLCFAAAKHRDLSGEEGFVAAAESVGEAIRRRISSGDPEGVLKGAETWLSDFEKLKPGRIAGIAGSPRFTTYETDFGFGKPRKCEVMSIDTTGTISIGDCRDSQEDVEISVSFPKPTMHAFAATFSHGLDILP